MRWVLLIFTMFYSLLAYITRTPSLNSVRLSASSGSPAFFTATNDQNLYCSVDYIEQQQKDEKQRLILNSLFLHNNRVRVNTSPLCENNSCYFTIYDVNYNFVHHLVDILETLDPSYLYKIKYSLFLHSNDRNLKIKPLVAHINGWETGSLSDENLLLYSLFQKFAYTNFKYHGYHVFKYDFIDLMNLDIRKYSLDIFKELADYSTSMNGTLHSNGIIDFNKSTRLIITRRSRDL